MTPTALPARLRRRPLVFRVPTRVAVWRAMRALGVRAGDAVAVPAFSCGAELEALLQAGLRLRVFGVGPALDPDPASFGAAVDGAAAALTVHYFGFPADLREARAICRAHGMPLVEDCVHTAAPPSGLGSAGAAVVHPLAAADRASMRQRCERYEEIARAVDGLPRVRLPCRGLRAGACPRFVPVVVDDTASLHEALAAAGVAAAPVWPWLHPAVAWGRFPDEAELKRRMIALPLHPSLADADVGRLVDAVRAWAR